MIMIYNDNDNDNNIYTVPKCLVFLLVNWGHMGPFPQDGNWPWVMWLFQKVWMVAVTKCEEKQIFFQLIMGNLFY